MTLPARAVCLYADDAQNVHALDRGIPRYIGEHLRALHALASESIHSVLLNPEFALSPHVSWLLGTGLLSFGTARPSRRERPRIYHLMSPFAWDTRATDLWPNWARDADVATVVTLYDAIPAVLPEIYLREPVWRELYESRCELARQADAVLALSESCAADAVERLGLRPDRVSVIGAGTSDRFANRFKSTAAAWRELSERLSMIKPGFILYVGGWDERKNLAGLIDAYERLSPAFRAAHQLVLTCRIPDQPLRELQERSRAAGLDAERAVLTGYVSDAELAALYRCCQLFVFPSLYEGAGLPILEAMSCGAPVAASGTSAMPELLGDRRATFDPRSPQAIADCIESILSSPRLSAELRERSRLQVALHTWSRVAERTIEAYEPLIGGARTGRARRPRLALVTPWPPERTGIATYSARLVEQLARWVDVDVVATGMPDRRPAPRSAGVQLVPAREFDGCAAVRQHDRILYCIGNSAYHMHALELLRQFPGAALFHDAYLGDLYHWHAERRHPSSPQAINELRATMYPELWSSAIAPLSDHSKPGGLGAPFMTRELQRLSEECFVHSRVARDVLALDRAPDDPSRPITVLPFAFPTAARPADRAMNASEPTIVSVGSIHPHKQIDLLIDAFELLVAEHPETRLVIAGYDHLGAESALRAGRRLNGAVRIAPDLNTATYSELLRSATVAVQLRSSSSGEASASVADCISAGTPTIVSDIGWASELPNGVAVRIPTDLVPQGLASSIAALLEDHEQRSAISESALEFAARNDFAAVAEAYVTALDL